MLGGIIILAIALHWVSFSRLARRLRAGSIRRGKAVGLYALIGLAPTVFFVGAFLILVGVEELFSAAIISEDLGRGAPIIGGLLLLLWIRCSVVFAVYSAPPGRLR